MEAGEGLTWATSFYWDRDEASRTWTARFRKLRDQLPTRLHAGTYSAVLHYLKAIEATGTDDGAAVAAAMRKMPLADDLFKGATIREDGRVMLDQFLMRDKSPKTAKGPKDYAEVVATVPASQAFRPLSAGGCPLVAAK